MIIDAVKIILSDTWMSTLGDHDIQVCILVHLQ